MFQPQVVTSLSHISDAVRNLLGNGLAHNLEEDTIAVSADKLQALADKVSPLHRVCCFEILVLIVHSSLGWRPNSKRAKRERTNSGN